MLSVCGKERECEYLKRGFSPCLLKVTNSQLGSAYTAQVLLHLVDQHSHTWGTKLYNYVAVCDTV